jgi:Uma2 family endonuclease
MGTATVYRELTIPEKKPRKVSLETFLRKYRDGAPGVKFEYNNGIIETSDTMKITEHYIILNLQKAFKKTKAFSSDDLLTSEIEVWTSPTQMRKPDLTFITLEQTRAAMDGYMPVPEFVIEVVSKNDNFNDLGDKIDEYFNAGVEIVWVIAPHLSQVQIHRKSSEDNIQRCSGDQICSAEPVVEGFKIKAADIFKRP